MHAHPPYGYVVHQLGESIVVRKIPNLEMENIFCDPPDFPVSRKTEQQKRLLSETIQVLLLIQTIVNIADLFGSVATLLIFLST